MSYQIALGNPLILFAREMGASATAIGLISGFTPLLAVLQLPMSKQMVQRGYRNTMLGGWTARVLTLLALCVMPFLSLVISHETIVWLIVAAMFLFNLSRGVATGAWLPWVTGLVSRKERGAFLSRDRTFISVASVVSLGISGAILSAAHTPGDASAMTGYAIIFALSFTAGLVSLIFLSRIPSPAPIANPADAPPALAWREILADKNFRTFTLFTVMWQILWASSGVFTVVFSREQTGLGDGALVWLSAGVAFAGMLGLQVVRPRIDKRGSKFFMLVVLGWWALHFSLWLMMALRVVAVSAELAAALMLTNGFFAAIFETSVTRLLMNTAGDRPGSPQYFAVQQVQTNLASGLAPIVWGVALDSLRTASFDRFSVFFAAQIVLVGVLALMLRRVREA